MISLDWPQLDNEDNDELDDELLSDAELSEPFLTTLRLINA